jgi:predicted RNase H-like HicB family nuclease
MELYGLQITIEELNDGGDYRYIAVSPDLPNLIVVGDTVEEVWSLAPQVAAALIASMKAAGDQLPGTLQVNPSLPFASHLVVSV